MRLSFWLFWPSILTVFYMHELILTKYKICPILFNGSVYQSIKPSEGKDMRAWKWFTRMLDKINAIRSFAKQKFDALLSDQSDYGYCPDDEDMSLPYEERKRRKRERLIAEAEGR